MATALSTTKNRFVGHSTKVPDDGVFHFCFSNPFQHAPNDYAPASVESPSPEHAFNGQPIPPQRPSLIHAGTGATLSWQRVRADSLRVARYLHAIVGSELPCDSGSEPVSSMPGWG